MEQYNKLIGTIASIRDVRIKRNAHEYSHELGVALETKFKFSKSSSKGNVYLNIVFFDASKNEEIDKENIEKNCEARQARRNMTLLNKRYAPTTVFVDFCNFTELTVQVVGRVVWCRFKIFPVHIQRIWSLRVIL